MASTIMQIKTILILLFLVSNAYSQTYREKLESIENCDYKLDNIELLVEGPNEYRKAILSPNAKMILLLGRKSIHVMEIKSKEIVYELQKYFDAQWINDSLILFREGKEQIIKALFSDNSYSSISIPDLEYIDGHILKARKGSESWIVANIESNGRLYCYGYLFSNDFKKTVIFSNSGETFVYKIDGSGLLSKIEFGIATDWSDDDSNIITFLDQDHGEHYVVESDLYIQNIETNKTCKLTNSESVLEFWPSWSRNKVSYIDDKNDNIYIADIISR